MNKILEKKISDIVNETVTKKLNELKENYNSFDRLIEYMLIKKEKTGLNEDILVDDGGSYKRWGHAPMLFVRNSVDSSVKEYIPFSISDDPKILDTDIDIKISSVDISHVVYFIKKNKNLLILLANEKISQIDFVQNMKSLALAVRESKGILMEMATLKKSLSHLPMTVWLDTDKLYLPHGPRLKFQSSPDQSMTREYSTMTLSKTPEIVGKLPKNTNLKQKHINMLKKFIINNLDLLLKLADGEIDYTTEFLPNMITAKQ